MNRYGETNETQTARYSKSLHRSVVFFMMIINHTAEELMIILLPKTPPKNVEIQLEF